MLDLVYGYAFSMTFHKILPFNTRKNEDLANHIACRGHGKGYLAIGDRVATEHFSIE